MLSITNKNHRPPSTAAKRRLKQTAQLLLLSVLGLSLGCGKSETRVPVFPVSGTVKFGSEIPAGANIVLHPASGANLPEDLAATGIVKADGSFKISVYEDGDGAPPGDYVGTIQWFKIVPEGGRGPNVLPDQYASKDTSPIKITVKSEPTQVDPITIN